MRTACYTGQNFDRPIKIDTCPCDASDYQCAYGFVSTDHWNGDRCIRNQSLAPDYDPWAIPETCVPGQFYNRTKGYFKIPQDECVGGQAKLFEPDQVTFHLSYTSFLLCSPRMLHQMLLLQKHQCHADDSRDVCVGRYLAR